MNTPTFLTSGDIARQLGADAMFVRHIIATRGIEHIGRAGLVRLFPESAVNEVQVALANVARRRRRKVGIT